MKNILTIILALACLATKVEAQSLYIGERIPVIDVDSGAGDNLKLVDQRLSCLIFMHTESQIAIEAIHNFMKLAAPYSDDMCVILLTTEQKAFDMPTLGYFAPNSTYIAFDNNGHTFKNFGIKHIPYAVVYTSRSRRAQWFGTLQQLDSKTLERLTNK